MSVPRPRGRRGRELLSTPRRPGYNGAMRPSPADPGPASGGQSAATRRGLIVAARGLTQAFFARLLEKDGPGPDCSK